MRPQSHMLPGTYLVSTWRIAAGISRAPTLEPDAQTISTQARCSNGQAGCQHKAQAGRGARIHTYTYIECRLGLTATYLSAMRGACSARQVPCTVVCTVLAGMYVSLHIAAWLEPDGACPTHKGSSALFFTPLPPVPLHCWWCRAPTLFPHGTTNTAIVSCQSLIHQARKQPRNPVQPAGLGETADMICSASQSTCVEYLHVYTLHLLRNIIAVGSRSGPSHERHARSRRHVYLSMYISRYLYRSFRRDRLPKSNSPPRPFFLPTEEKKKRTERNGTEQNGTEQNGTEQNGTEQNGTEQNGTEQNGTEQNGTEQNNHVGAWADVDVLGSPSRNSPSSSSPSSASQRISLSPPALLLHFSPFFFFASFFRFFLFFSFLFSPSFSPLPT